MTTRTLFTTWTRLTGETLGADERAVGYLTSEVERLLEPYEAWLLGNGDIVGPVALLGDFQAAMDDPYGIREELLMIGGS
mgnify:CR=1 FL=1